MKNFPVFAAVSNGVVGLRIGPNPFEDARCTVNGHSGAIDPDRVESNALVPYPLAADLRLGNWWTSQSPGNVEASDPSYDFQTGELTSRLTVTLGQVRAELEVVTFVSRTLPTLVLQETRITVDAPAKVAFRSVCDLTTAQGQVDHREVFSPRAAGVDACLRIAANEGSSCGLAVALEGEGARSAELATSFEPYGRPRAFSVTLEAPLQPGQVWVVRQMASLVPSLMHHEPDRQAVRNLHAGVHRGFDTLRRQNREAWVELWKGRIVLEGAEPKWQKLADACFFYLHTMIHPATPCSTPLLGQAFGSDYHNFRGHIFWDLENYTFPGVLLGQPEAARAMLDYRFDRLPAARWNARMNGYRGVQFPWESSPSRGEEVVPVSYAHIVHEQHISLDVAFAFLQAWFATGDEELLRTQVWAVVKGVAEWIVSRVEKTLRGYEIKGVIGIAEFETPVDNNSYTNMAASVILREAGLLAPRMGFAPPPEWEAISKGLYLKVEQNIILNNESFGLADAPHGDTETLPGFFPFTYRAPPGIEEATYRYYVTTQAEKAEGWPMLPPLLSVFAARLGDRNLALSLAEANNLGYCFGPFDTMDEFGANFLGGKPRVGPYMAHVGAFVLNCLLGYTGLRLDAGDPAGWSTRPVSLPAGWTGIHVERLWVRDRPASLHAQQGQKARITFLEENP